MSVFADDVTLWTGVCWVWKLLLHIWIQHLTRPFFSNGRDGDVRRPPRPAALQRVSGASSTPTLQFSGLESRTSVGQVGLTSPLFSLFSGSSYVLLC